MRRPTSTLKMVIAKGAEKGDELSDEDFDSFPIDDLSKLSNEIMKYSGMGKAPQAQKKS